MKQLKDQTSTQSNNLKLMGLVDAISAKMTSWVKVYCSYMLFTRNPSMPVPE